MQKLYEESNIQAIADAIRAKTGRTDTYKPRDMAGAISAIEGRDPSCNGRHIPDSALNFTGNCQNLFANDKWAWLIDEYGNDITTSGITNTSFMFSGSTLIETVPFDLNCNSKTYIPSSNMFASCSNLKEIKGVIRDLYPQELSSMFQNCNSLRYLPKFENLNLDRYQSYAYSSAANMIQNCYSLRAIDESLLKQIYKTGNLANWTYGLFYGIQNLYALDEIGGLNPNYGTLTSDIFSYAFNNLYRAKDIKFGLDDSNVPYHCNWSKQSINMSVYVGYASKNSLIHPITGYNSGITADKEVKDDATYAALKDDPDWFTHDIAYSRYNRLSAINTINSLPDVTQGSGNTIKFTGNNGSKTDGGAINTMTEEEIAVATAKGWTVTFV